MRFTGEFQHTKKWRRFLQIYRQIPHTKELRRCLQIYRWLQHTREWRICLQIYRWIPTHQRMNEMSSDLPANSSTPKNGGDAFGFTGEFQHTREWEDRRRALPLRSKVGCHPDNRRRKCPLSTYDRNSVIMKAFCGAWHPTTNILWRTLKNLSYHCRIWVGGSPIVVMISYKDVPRIAGLIDIGVKSVIKEDNCLKEQEKKIFINEVEEGISTIENISMQAWIHQ